MLLTDFIYAFYIDVLWHKMEEILFLSKISLRKLTPLNKQNHAPLLAVKPAMNRKQLASVYCSSIIECILEQTAFQKAGVPGTLKVFKAGFSVFHVKHSTALLPKTLVRIAEKKCLIGRQ